MKYISGHRRTFHYALIIVLFLIAATSFPQTYAATTFISGWSNLQAHQMVHGILDPGPELRVHDATQVRQINFELLNANGKVLFTRTEKVGKYCVTGGDTECAAWDLSAFESGAYTLRATATGKNGQTEQAELDFTLAYYFKPIPIPGNGTPAAPTSRIRPPLLSDASQNSWGVSQGLAPQMLFWEQVPAYQEKKTRINQVAADIEAAGKVPCGGLQRWEDTFMRSQPKGTYPDAPARLNDGIYADLPGHKAWVNWIEDRPQYLGADHTGQSLPKAYRSWGGDWGYISPLVPLQSSDYPEHYTGNKAYYADWIADKLGTLAGFTGARCYRFSDFYDSHPHIPIKDYFNARIIQDFQQRTNISLSATTLSEQAKEIRTKHLDAWSDFWSDRWAYGWAAIAREIKRNTGKEPWLQIQNSFSVAGQHSRAFDARAIVEHMSANHILFLVQTVQHLHSDRISLPESYASATLGTYAAREPNARYGHMLEASHEEFWEPVAATWPELSTTTQEELGWKRLKRVWLESGWTHVATRQGTVRRAVEAFQRHYWDKGTIDEAWLSLIQDIYPARPFGPAMYYSVNLERIYEQRIAQENRNHLNDAYLGKNLTPVTNLREAGLPFNYYVSDAALPNLKPDFRPTAWLVPDRYINNQDKLPANERQVLESIAPILDAEQAKAHSPLRFSTTQTDRTITGFGFFDQHGRLIIMAGDQIKLGESNNALNAVQATITLDLPDGQYTAKELFTNKVVNFTVREGTGTFTTTLDRWDTQVFAVTQR